MQTKTLVCVIISVILPRQLLKYTKEETVEEVRSAHAAHARKTPTQPSSICAQTPKTHLKRNTRTLFNAPRSCLPQTHLSIRLTDFVWRRCRRFQTIQCFLLVRLYLQYICVCLVFVWRLRASIVLAWFWCGEWLEKWSRW